MIAKVYSEGETVLNPATGNEFEVKANQTIVAWEIERLEKAPIAVMAISIPFTNPNAADDAAIRLSNIWIDDTHQE